MRTGKLTSAIFKTTQAAILCR